jgi:NADH pyrophosphatase NudC (nudix superfamily)
MTDYTELVKALRCKRDDCEGCDLAFFDKDEGWMCQYAAKDDDAADAIERLIAERDEAKTDLAAVGRAYIREIEKHEPKLGEWVEANTRPRSAQFYCSVCHRTCYDIQPTRDKAWTKRCRYKFCPNCGAKMEMQE